MRKIPVFAKCLISSIFSACIDFGLFYVVNKFCVSLGFGQKSSIVAATVASRICSTLVNFLINKFWCFENKEKGAAVQAAKFFVLFVAKMAASAALVSLFAGIFTQVSAVLIKVIVDSVLFFASFFIQKKFIF